MRSIERCARGVTGALGLALLFGHGRAIAQPAPAGTDAAADPALATR